MRGLRGKIIATGGEGWCEGGEENEWWWEWGFRGDLKEKKWVGKGVGWLGEKWECKIGRGEVRGACCLIGTIFIFKGDHWLLNIWIFLMEAPLALEHVYKQFYPQLLANIALREVLVFTSNVPALVSLCGFLDTVLQGISIREELFFGY